jgi:hypothetical protein
MTYGFGPEDATLVMDMLAETVVQAFVGGADAAASDEPDGWQRRRHELIGGLITSTGFLLTLLSARLDRRPPDEPHDHHTAQFAHHH